MNFTAHQVRARTEGGGVFAPALWSGSGANRDASIPGCDQEECLL